MRRHGARIAATLNSIVRILVPFESLRSLSDPGAIEMKATVDSDLLLLRCPFGADCFRIIS